MAWKIELSTQAQRDLDRLDPPVARRVLSFLHQRVARLDDPRSIGEALSGPMLAEFWKYRVGDWRIVARIEDDVLHVLVLNVGNRREVYRSQ